MNPTLYSESHGDGMPLVLLHGWGWSSSVWRSLIPELAEHYRVIVIDLPGFGHSPLPAEGYDMQQIAEQLIAIVPYPAYWLGWSLGGLVATWLTIHYPQQVSKLITVASSPYFIKTDDWPGTKLAILAEFSLSLAKNFQQAIADFLNLQLRGSPKLQNAAASFADFISPISPPLTALHNSLSLLEHTDLRPDLRRIQCPSLHIFGSLDMLVPVAVVDAMRQLHSQGEYVIIRRAGHMPFLSHTEEFLAEVNKFLLNKD